MIEDPLAEKILGSEIPEGTAFKIVAKANKLEIKEVDMAPVV